MRKASGLLALAAGLALGVSNQPVAAPRRDGLRITDLFPELMYGGTPHSIYAAGKRGKSRPKVNPAGTKLARMAKEGRCGVWK